MPHLYSGPEILEFLGQLGPEIIIVFGLLWIVFMDMFLDLREKRVYIPIFTGLTLICGLVAISWYFITFGSGHYAELFGGTVKLDHFVLFMKGLFFLSGAFVVGMSYRQREVPFLGQAEYYSLILSTVLGASLLAGAKNLIVIYISFEFISISQYVLTGMKRGEKGSMEASLKYLLYGAVASGAMLFGMSLLYGLTGTLSLEGIHAFFGNYDVSTFGAFAIFGLILAGMGFKISAVPFHMWTPDVYQGAPTPVVAFFSVAPKAAGFALLIHFFFGVHGASETSLYQVLDWPMLFAVLSVASMTLGNLAALWQTNIKRLLAYSTIAQAGYMLMGLVAGTSTGLESVLIYLVVYMFMNLGVFVTAIALIDATGSTEISDYRGLGWSIPIITVPMAIFLFSLTGLPPTAGFIAKFLLFYAVADAGWSWLVAIGLLNTVFSLYYYIKVIRTLFLEEEAEAEIALKMDISRILPSYQVITIILLVPTIGFFLNWAPLEHLARMAIQGLPVIQ